MENMEPWAWTMLGLCLDLVGILFFGWIGITRLGPVVRRMLDELADEEIEGPEEKREQLRGLRRGNWLGVVGTLLLVAGLIFQGVGTWLSRT